MYVLARLHFFPTGVANWVIPWRDYCRFTRRPMKTLFEPMQAGLVIVGAAVQA